MNNYATVLESYLIPAQEGEYLNELKDIAKSQIKEAGKEILPMFGVFGIMCAALGIYSKIKNYKDKKASQAKMKASDEYYERARKDAFNKLDTKYKFSAMTKNDYNKFIDNMYDEIIRDISKMLKPLNSKEILNKYKEKYISKYKKMASYSSNPHKYDDDIKDADKWFRPGLFKIVANDIPDYVCIIDGDQEINTFCHAVCEDVAEALELKYSEFCAAGLFGVGTGDGDEGCVYPEFVSSETMRKRYNM